ncbi:VRR-NUC domain-containing protein [Acetobacteraceae bacterium ESL0709]|nr:VRR-NUC domain-containing protein [Acetobacteraceae bacterium ESL0697]MDF7677408.1 VRR-NUC domain-containing protein [Acetobacteraceae bacterium ESL0709]
MMVPHTPFPMVAPVSEDDLHKAVASLLTVIIAEQGKLSPLGVWWCSIEHRNAKSAREGARRKRRGVIAGIPDIMIGYDHRSFWIELKTDKGTLSTTQKCFHAVLRASGHVVDVCRSLEDVRACLEANRIPVQRIAGIC